jgi:hypothetical protein
MSVTYGWRTGIFWTSIPAIAAALVIHLFVRDLPSGEVVPDGDGASVLNSEPGRALAAPAGGYAGPALISSGYMGHMWELYAFWGWIGPFVVSSILSTGQPVERAVDWGGGVTAAIILLGVPSCWLWGIVADRRGRTFAIIVAGLCSVFGELLIGMIFGRSLALLVLVGGWIGFWSIADGTIYKAGLVEMVAPGFHGFSLGLQSAMGFGMTIISPAVFGLFLQWYNGPVDPGKAVVWMPAFLILAMGGLFSPLCVAVLRRIPQAKLMCGGKM